MSQQLRHGLGGFWDIYTAGEGMISYSIPCQEFIELTGASWVALLCRTTGRGSTKAWES